MQPTQQRPIPPLPQNHMNQTSQPYLGRYPSQSRIPMDRNSTNQSSGNLLAIHPRSSMHKSSSIMSMQSMDSSESNLYEQSNANSNLNPQQYNNSSNFNQQPSENYSNVYQSQPYSNPNFGRQSSNPNFCQQNNNYPNQPINHGMPQSPSTPSLHNLSSNLSQQSSSEHVLPGQVFHVVYNDTTYMVDPIKLGKSSLKFRELILPFIHNTEQVNALHLEIRTNQFSDRNMNNFLKLCQQLPTDVQNSEMEEICEIAKMFKAEDIYNLGIAFIKQHLDPNFDVPDNKYDGSDGITYLYIDDDIHAIHHEEDSDQYFEDANNSSYQGNYYKINDANKNNNSADKESENFSSPNQIQNQPENKLDLENHDLLHDPNYKLNQELRSSSQQFKNPATDENNDIVQNAAKTDHKEDIIIQNEFGNIHSIVYQVRVENHTIKCPKFKFVKDNQIIYTAKQKYSNIYIAKGSDIHIRNKANHVAHITQNEFKDFNTVNLQDTHFVVNYVNSGKPGHMSIEVSFPFKDKIVNWVPKPPRFDPPTGKYFLNFHGEYHHTPIRSSRNIVLQNKAGSPTFIVRRMDQCVFEIECLPIVDPLIAFCIGLSDIVGPYIDPWSNIDYFL
ncbi:hypothetical protein M9Y10_008857 [Tritrichomonas musculus]|uniref:Tubby C-terminal domain-containing protein n=1 Tax=Tritrichomonas musculus TaxID=1915356 RepID=A0ABR2J0B9_9EUKA